MADAGFNGSSVTLTATPISAIRSIRYQGRCAKVKTTGANASIKSYEPGLPDETLTIEVLGSTALTKGSTPSVTVAWNDGGADGSMTKGRIMKTPSMSGSEDAENISTIVIKPSK